MYLNFYHLKSAPFQSAPDPDFLFLSAGHRAVLDVLAAGLATRQGLVVITGPPGVGKTTLVHAYLARIAPPQLITIVSWHAHLSFLDLLDLLTRHFAVPETIADAKALVAQLQQRLRDEAHWGRMVALIIDEAQHLPPETLEQLLVLASPTSATEPLFQLVLVGQPALQQHLRRRALRRVAQRIGSYATLDLLTEAESLAYIRQRVARVALPGGPIFTPGALTALVRHAHGVPRDLNRLCTTVLQAGYVAQQQPITADLVRHVLAASRGARSWSLGRLGLAIAAVLVLVGGVLFSAGLQVSRSRPAVPAHSWMEARRPTSVPQLGAPRPPQPDVASQARTESPLDGAVGHASDEGHVRLGPWESLESQHLERPPVTLPSPPPAIPLPASTSPSPAAPPPSPTLIGPALKSCDALKAEIQAKLAAKSLTGYALTILASGDAPGHQIVGSCEGNTKKIALNRSRNVP
jgi:type II secretory pathway predicted ATPase ExeA